MTQQFVTPSETVHEELTGSFSQNNSEFKN
jgi:hypothetical protein